MTPSHWHCEKANAKDPPGEQRWDAQGRKPSCTRRTAPGSSLCWAHPETPRDGEVSAQERGGKEQLPHRSAVGLPEELTLRSLPAPSSASFLLLHPPPRPLSVLLGSPLPPGSGLCLGCSKQPPGTRGCARVPQGFPPLPGDYRLKRLISNTQQTRNQCGQSQRRPHFDS